MLAIVIGLMKLSLLTIEDEDMTKTVSIYEAKHDEYIRNSTYLIGGLLCYLLVIRILRNNCGIRCCAYSCFGYVLILIRISLFVFSCYFLSSKFYKIVNKSFELYNENSEFYGILSSKMDWFSFIVCGMIWGILVLVLLIIVILFISFLVFLRIRGFIK